MKTMPALVNYSSEPLSVELREIAVPTIGARDVLLEVGAVGVCGSDVHQWRGMHSWAVNYPVVLGHEFCGTVIATGAEVKAFKEGDRVVSETAAVIDETSPYTRQGLYNLDPGRKGFGYGVDGAMTSYVRVPERCLHHLPDGVSFEKAALTEPCCVAYNAVCVNARVRPGDAVLVLGPGPIGLLCAVMAKLSGASHIIVAGLPSDAKRLELSRKLGADVALSDGVLEHVKNFGDGLGVDLVIDAAGASATLQLAMQAVRPAGQIVKVGWGPQPLGFSLDPIVAKAVTLQGSFSHTWAVWERVIALIAAGRIPLETMIGRVSPLEGWLGSFEAMHHTDILKAVLLPNGQR
jgi:L-iditol 2-dehydrogenase